MSSFDVSEYLRSKADFTSSGIPEITPIGMSEMVGKKPLENRMSKTDNLIEASRQKEYALKMESIAKREALAKENESSLITKLGLEYDSGLGGAINLGAIFLDRTAKIASGAIAAPFSLRGQYKEQLIDPVSLDILKRQEAGEQLTPEELKVINTPIKSDLSIGPVTLPATINSQTPKEVYEGYFGLEGSKRIAREFRKATDISFIVNKEAEGLMQQELLADPKAVEALKRVSESKVTDIKKEDVATLIANAVKVGGNNPLAVANLIASNMPNAILAGISPMALATTNIGYSQEYYDKWSDNFAKREGREPTLEEKKQAQLEAFSLAAAETVGDLLTASTAKALGASLGLGKKAVGVITPEAFKASLGAFGQTTAGAIASKAVPVIANAAKATGQVALASVGEAGTEGYQTNTESRLEKGVNASPEDIYFGMTAGALSSGGITASSAGVGLAKDVFGAAKEIKETYQERKEAKTEAYNTAVETGDVTPLMDQTNPLKSDWVGATEAIIENASLEGKTDEDVKTALGKVDKEIVSKLEASIKSFSLNTEAKVDIYNKEIEKINTFLEQNPDSEKAKALLAKYTAERDAPIDPAKEEQANKFIGQLQTKLNEVVSLREGLAAREIESEANVIEAAKAITTPPSTTGTTDTTKPAVDVTTFIVRAMKLRGSKSAELATAIESVISSGKATSEEVKTLRILADEVIASNKAKNVSKVSENVLFGSGEIKGVSPTPGIDFKGVFNYQETFEKALSIGDKETANKEFEGLKTFVIAHGKKQEAYSQLKPNQMIKFTNKGEWEISDIPKGYTQQQAVEEARKNGGFAWFGNKPNKGYANTMKNIDNEISIMVPVLQKMSLQIGKPINNEELVSVKQTPKAKQASQEGQEVSGATAVNTGTKQTGTGTSEAPTQPTVNKPKVSVTPEGTSTPNNIGAPNGQGQKEKVLSTPPTEVGSGSTQQPTTASPTGQGVVVSDDTKAPLNLLFGNLLSTSIASLIEAVNNETVKNKQADFDYFLVKFIKDISNISSIGFYSLDKVREQQSKVMESGEFEWTKKEQKFGDVYYYPKKQIEDGIELEKYVYKTDKYEITSSGTTTSVVFNSPIMFGEFEVKTIDGELGSIKLTSSDYAQKYINGELHVFGKELNIDIDSNNKSKSKVMYRRKSGIRSSGLYATFYENYYKIDPKYRSKNSFPLVFDEKGNNSYSKTVTTNPKTPIVQSETTRYEPTNVDYSGLARVGTLLDNKQGSKRENEDGSISYVFDNLSITLKQGNIFVLDMRNPIALIDGSAKPKEFSNWEDALKEIETLTKNTLTPQQKVINESQKELFEEKAASTPEATAEGESQENTDDTTGDGTSSSDNSDELNAGEEVIKEEARYTSKQEVLKAIRKKQQAFADFINCL